MAVDKVDKRLAIVSVGVEVLGELGLAGLTQPRVARRVGLAQGHLTYYFPTRDALVAAVVDEAARQRIAALERAHAAGGPQEVVTAVARVLASPAQARVLLALAQAADGHESVRASFAALRTAVTPLGVALLEQHGVTATRRTLGLLHACGTGIAVRTLAGDTADPVALAEALLTELLDQLAAAQRAPS